MGGGGESSSANSSIAVGSSARPSISRLREGDGESEEARYPKTQNSELLLCQYGPLVSGKKQTTHIRQLKNDHRQNPTAHTPRTRNKRNTRVTDSFDVLKHYFIMYTVLYEKWSLNGYKMNKLLYNVYYTV
jgi:hypothetical protein